MNLIIPLKNDSRYDQLKFALRSITKYHPEITDCILVGGKPDWYTGQHLPHKDYGPMFKEANIRDKVLAGCEYLQLIDTNGSACLRDEFLFANDDHILLAPITQTYNKGLLSDCLKTRIGNGSYTRCLRNTLNHYGDVDNVDIHCPMFMTMEGVQRTAFGWPEFGIGFKTCYAVENQVSSVFMEDCKTDKLPVGMYCTLDVNNKETWHCSTRQWFSLTDNFPLQKLVGLFPEKSIFEM